MTRLQRFWWRLSRWLRRSGPYGTKGRYVARGVDISFGGACPVQGIGLVDGHACYYRSRGQGFAFHVFRFGLALGPDDDLPDEPDLFTHSELLFKWPEAGFVQASESKKHIARAVAAFRARKR